MHRAYDEIKANMEKAPPQKSGAFKNLFLLYPILKCRKNVLPF